MKTIKFLPAIVLLGAIVKASTSKGLSFRPASYVFTEEDYKKLTRTTRRQPSRLETSIIFPTAQTTSSFLQTVTVKPTTIHTNSKDINKATVKPQTGNYTEQKLENLTSLPTKENVYSQENVANQTNLLNSVTECPSVEQAESKMTKSYLTDDIIRSKLCSNISSANLSREYRFDLDAKVCSPTGIQSHCGKNMKFYSFAGNNVYGHCDCDYSSRIPLVYHAETNRCYFMYQQGFCKQNEWIEMIKANGTVVCKNNKCYNLGRRGFGALPLASRDIPPEYVPLGGNGPCVKLNQPNAQLCNAGDIVAFRWPSEFYPNCGKPFPAQPTLPPLSSLLPNSTSFPFTPSVRFLGEVASLKCGPGSYLNAVGGCQPDWDFD